MKILSKEYLQNKKRTNFKCEECKTGYLIVRQNTENEQFFMGCSNYPECRYTEKFRIEEIALNRQNGGIQFRLDGLAGHIRSGPPEFLKDHRLTRFDALWQNPRLVILFSILVWVFPTTLGGYKLYKELSRKLTT